MKDNMSMGKNTASVERFTGMIHTILGSSRMVNTMVKEYSCGPTATSTRVPGRSTSCMELASGQPSIKSLSHLENANTIEVHTLDGWMRVRRKKKSQLLFEES